MKKQKKCSGLVRGIIIVLSAVGIAGILFAVYRTPQVQREDYRRIASMEYDTVFLAMYPLDTYQEEDFAHYRAMTLLKVSYCIPRFSVMEEYMRKIAKSGNTITTAYLGICPDRVDAEKLQALINRYPSVMFEVIISCPSADYWRNLSQKDYEDILDAYCNFLSAIPDNDNAHFYFMSSEEWLINNPSNYIDEWTVTEAAATTIMVHSDVEHEYQVMDPDAAILSLKETTGRLRLEEGCFCDLSDVCVVFFGDSVIGNYTDSMSVPGVVGGLTGASVFNCGYGGNSAVPEPTDDIALPGIVEAFFDDDVSVLPQNEQVYRGVASYWAEPPKDKRLCFVINYGLNDYFCGHVISAEDPYDVGTYCGAIRTAVNTIRKNTGDVQIILCTPNFVAVCEEGTEPHGPMENVLSDYADAVIALSLELGTDVLDNFHELGITVENNGEYLVDKIHPGFSCRYLMGKRLSLLIR